MRDKTMLRRPMALLLAAACPLGASPAWGASTIVRDGSVGGPPAALTPAGTITRGGTTYNAITIPESYGTRAGANVFHSFSTFNVGTGDGAVFTIDGATNNVISRVTGGTPSTINGLLTLDPGSTGSHPNFFFINPAGITFGSGALVDVPAAFHASTANYLKFPDGRFYADTTHVSTFSTADPVAFGFLGTTRASVAFRNGASILADAPKDFDVVAGDAVFNGVALDDLGDVRIVALGKAGLEVPLAGELPEANGNLRIVDSTITTASYSALPGHPISLSAGAISLDFSDVLTKTYDAGAAGDVYVQGGSLLLTDGSRLGSIAQSGSGSAGNVTAIIRGNVAINGESQLLADTRSDGQGGNLFLSAAQLTLDDYSWVSSDSTHSATGDAGTVVASVSGRTTITNGSWISADSYNAGRGGSVYVSTGSLSIDGGTGTAGISSDSLNGTGNGGNVSVFVSDATEIVNGGRISTIARGSGSAGQVFVTTGSLLIDGQDTGDETGVLALADYGSTGNAGSVWVNASGAITLRGGGRITSTARGSGSGSAGGVLVTADSLRIEGDPNGYETGIFARAASDHGGDSGVLLVSVTNGLSLIDNASISTSTYAGNAGYIFVDAGSIDISGIAGIYSNAYSSSTGNAGYINVRSAGDIRLTGGGQISTNTEGPGAAGAVSVQGTRILIDGAESFVSATASAGSSGQTGNVSVSAGESITLSNGGRLSIENDATVAAPDALIPTTLHVSAPSITLNNAHISAASRGNVAASDIRVDFVDRLYLDPSSISTSANLGNGGSINISGNGTLILDNSQITTSVAGLSGNGGNIDIRAGNLIMKTGFIQANTAADNASGGDINIDVRLLVPSGNTLFLGGTTPYAFRPGIFGFNVIQAAAPTGISGTVQVTSPALDISGSLTGLNAKTLDSGGLGRSPCQIGGGSSLARVGRGGFLPSARGLLELSSPAAADEAGSEPPATTSALNAFNALALEDVANGRCTFR